MATPVTLPPPLNESPINVIGFFNQAWISYFRGLSARLDQITGPGAGALLRSGGTMDGALVLAGPPVVALQAATKSYVDTSVAASAGVGSTYTFTQATPSATWVISHNLSRFPSVSVVDSAGTEVEGAVAYTSANQVVVNFSAGFAGVAYLN